MSDTQCCISGVCDFHNALNAVKEAALRALSDHTGVGDPEKPWWNLNMPKALDIMLPAICEAIAAESPTPDLLAVVMRRCAEARRKALTEAWQAVEGAVRPLGYGGGATNSPWNEGYEQAKNEALNAILALRARG